MDTVIQSGNWLGHKTSGNVSEVILYKQQIDEKYFTHFHPQRMDEFKNNMLHALIDGPLGYIAKEIIHKPLGSVILHCTTSFIFFFQTRLTHDLN